MLWKGGSRESTGERITTFIGSVESLCNSTEARSDVSTVAPSAVSGNLPRTLLNLRYICFAPNDGYRKS